MKKQILSALSAILMGASALAAPMSSFAGAVGPVDVSNNYFVFLDDGLSSYTDRTGNNPYIDIIKDYYSQQKSVEVCSDYSFDKCSSAHILSTIDTIKSDIKDSEYIIISVGLNDYIAAVKKIASEKYHISDSEDLFGSLLTIANIVRENGGNAVSEFAAFISVLKDEFESVSASTLENITQMRNKIKACNPDAHIIVSTVYNPVLISETGLNTLLKGKPSEYSTGYTMIRNLLNNSLNEFNSSLKGISGIKIADVAAAFTVEGSNGKYGYADIFTDIISSDKHGIYPNELGCVAASAEIIKAIGYKENFGDSTYLTNNYDPLPAESKSSLREILGIKLGDGDKNGVIDASDASLALSIYASAQIGQDLYDVADAANLIALDTDLNGTVDASDASTILAHYADVQSDGKGIL